MLGGRAGVAEAEGLGRNHTKEGRPGGRKGGGSFSPHPRARPDLAPPLSLELRLSWVGGCLEVTPMLQGVGIWALAL